MRATRAKLFAGATFLSCAISARASAQQDGLVAYPNVYRVQFENPYVRLIRVQLPGNARLADHTHPPGVMLHVYFTDADPVQFNHDGPPNDVTRPSVTARSYRVGRATPETHSVNNMGPRLSDYMRVELKTIGDEGQRSRVPATPIVNANSSVAEVTNSQYRSSRVTVASGQSMELTAGETQPFLLLALVDGISATVAGNPSATLETGDSFFVDPMATVSLRNSGTAPIQLLRVDFLTKPIR